VQQFKQLRDFPPSEVGNYAFFFKADGVDKRRYNAPTAAEVAGFMPGGENTGGHREFKVRCRDGDDTAWEMDDLHALCDPLRFVLFHPRGERGYNKDEKQHGSATKKLLLMEATKFFLHDYLCLFRLWCPSIPGVGHRSVL
jgi:hypothetical protein